MRIVPHYSSSLPIGMADHRSNVAMYYYKLDEYPSIKEEVINHELDHLSHTSYDIFYHIWIDYRDTIKLFRKYPELKKIMKTKDSFWDEILWPVYAIAQIPLVVIRWFL